MLAECSNCGYKICRYWRYLPNGDDNYNRPCDKCGCTILKVIHLGAVRLGNYTTHYIIYDVNDPPTKCAICDDQLERNMKRYDNELSKVTFRG